MKQQRILIALLLSLVFSAGFTFVLSRSMKGQSKPKSTPDVLYAAPSHALEAGEVLKAESLQMISWPSDKPLHGAFGKSTDLLGRAVLYPLAPGEPILDRDVSAVGVGVGLAARIPGGMRAIALKSDEVAGVAGFLNPGSHVDVLVTYHPAQSSDAITATVLKNVQVIAVGQRAQPDPDGKPTPTVTVVTLLLSPEESERAVLASSQGVVHFVLRNGADTERPASEPMQLSMLAGGPAPPPIRVQVAPTPAPVASQRPPAPKGPEIETVLGNEGQAKREGSAQQ